MYPITDEVAELYKKHYRQVVKITFDGTEETLYLTEENIIQSGLIIDRRVVSGSKIEIGSAIAAQLTLTLNNYDETFNDVVFEGAELFVSIGVKKWDADAWENAQIHYMPVGYFTVDETPRKTTQLTLTALDRMAQTDKDVDFDSLTFPCTARALLKYACDKCLIPLYENNLDSLPNIDYSIPAAPDTDGLTYRQIIQWIAELTGTCAYIDWNGYMRLTWYVDTDTEITSAERYTGADLYENDITITGVQITDLDDETYLSGEEGYIFNIEGNSLIQDNYQDVADNLGAVLTGTTYRPYSCTTVPMPWVYPMDYITYADKKGVSHSALVTHTIFTLNSSTTIKGVGESATSNGYASSNPLTARERLILEKMKASTSKQIDELSTVDLQRYNLLLELNQTMANSLGLYMITDTSAGATKYYFADTENLEDATVIYCFTSGGFAWVQGEGCYEDAVAGNWSSGITSTGNAILNILSVYKLTANQISAEVLSVENITYSNGKTLAEQLDLYITSDSLQTTLSSYVTTSDLSDYAKTSDLSGYAKTSELSAYVTSSSLELTLASYALTSDLSDYAKTSELTSYITSDSLQTTLSSYVTTSTLSTKLGSYVTTTTLTSQLSSYVSSTSLKTTLESYATVEGGEDSSFSYELTSSNFILTADGTEVFVCDKDGVAVTGKITATSGTIGGFTIGETYLTYSGKMTINSSSGDIKFWKSTATSNGTYANLDGDGLGSVWRGTDNVTYPYAYLNAYAQGGLELVYRPSSSATAKTFKIYFPYIAGVTTYGYCPRLYSTDDLYFAVPNTIVGGNIYGDSDAEYTLGTSNRYWSDVYVDSLHNGSDRKLKSDIETLSDAYTILFDNLEPVRYKKDRDKTKRYHTGFIAQNVEEAIETAGLTVNEFACYNYDEETDMRNLCYDELIALCVNEIQKLKARVKELEENINETN